MTPRGVNYAGFLGAALGLGEAARGYVEALRAQGFDVRSVDADEVIPGRGRNGSASGRGPLSPADFPHPVNIVHINPDLLHNFWHHAGAGFFRNRFTVGIWAWETPVFPREWTDRFDLVDEIWVGGSYMARGISMASPVPVLVMPHVVEAPDVPADRSRFRLEPDEFIFLFSFDFHSSPLRKNPQAVISAFKKAFDPREPARLVIKSINGASRPDKLRELKEACGGHRVTFMDQVLTGEDRSRLLASSDCFVSLHRAEGFGLGIAEAMAGGKPVIATGWSGNMDFMNQGNSFPVKFSLAPLEEDDPPYRKGPLWAVPDIDDAAARMRLVYDDRGLARRVGEAAAEHLRSHNSSQVIGAMISSRLELISGRLGRPRGGRGVSLMLRRLRMGGVRILLRIWLGVLAIIPKSWHRRLRKITEGPRNRASNML